MKTLTIDIHPQLKGVEITVKNGRRFSESLIRGEYENFLIEVSDKDIARVKHFAVHMGDDKSSCKGNWYAHCNGYAMDLCVTNKGRYIYINTYRPYGRAYK